MKIHTIGGFNEVGKNMTVIELQDDAIILDSGFYLPAIVELQEQERNQKAYSEKKLRDIGGIADDTLLDKLGIRNKVRAMLIGHAHLDHVGAVPYVSYRYNAPVVGTPFTIEVLKKLLDDEKMRMPNKISTVKPNGTFEVKGKKRNYRAEFINITHSTIQTAMIAIHTPEGVVVYANDFKLDNTPIVGLPPNYEAMKRIAKEGVKVLIVDSLYSSSERKTPSEKVARVLLEEVLLTVENKRAAIFVATFSSHIARLKSIVDFAKKINRNVYFIGRSLNKYVSAAKNVNLCPFLNKVQIGSYKGQVASMLKRVERNRAKSLVVCTGHQGEPGSILDRLSRSKLPFSFQPKDHVIFASKTIPAPINIANKENLDKRLKKTGVRIFDQVHVSGHGGREDLRDLIEILQPQNIIPSHGSTQQLTPMIELCRELGYRAGKECHLMQDGQTLNLKK
ncbi:MBL fold metallo-hydrolase [archaeon]|jgi:ribonuclease J|nr:MBL fold metallo-hydrolase [archaeon]MBT4373595.1 MBL fold metallo-hydrolase [archaeon]MBT4532043.1 MBL fold metallo-hydrolase [archaeon]MBT7001710.1 MBL fold metallo-hydrolase [archaeon]MBT7282398.1 MBL fold metallo-hydrolase [archaeon]